jgi:CRISPR-associated protein Cas1
LPPSLPQRARRILLKTISMRQENPNLWELVTSHEGLQEAWYKVQANDGSPGGDQVTLRDFKADLFANLMQLRAELLGGTNRS